MESLHQPNNIIAQKYRIINTLGEGGSGITYLAQDLQNNKTVALKALSLHRMTDWKAMELFEREAKTLAQLNHRAIPQYLEYFDADVSGEKHFYIAQQLAPGKSLAKLVEENWRTNEQQLRDIAAQILEILIYLHSQTPAVTHRDIKPQNIIRNENGKVFLVDFGAVQDTYYSTFMHGSTVVGTYGYMAPEQFQGKSVPATDLYGLGATLLFLLTHHSPADFPTDGLKIDFRSRIKVSDDFADWLDKMLEPDLEERFTSAKVALEVLRGKRKIITAAKKPMLWKIAMAMGITTVVSVGIFNNYKWRILETLGFSFFPNQRFCSNVDEIKNYLNQGGNPNPYFSTSPQKTLLICAIEANSQSTVELLIAKGANINHSLPYIKSVDWLKFLIAQGADINRKDYGDKTLLHYAVINNKKEIIELLLLHNLDVNAKDYSGNTPLHLVAGLNHNNRIDLDYYLFIRNEPHFDKRSENIRLGIIKLLVDNDAIIDIKNNDENTALHLSIKTNYQDIAKYLLEKGTNFDAKNKKGKTPLMYAVEEVGSIPIMKLLIDSGADINAKDNEGNTVLDIAAKYGNKELVEKFIKDNTAQ
ncbi:MAG: ankyrin repeat domain-containing protein [Rivularia sp. (in: Bacteria)]|nr:ankyrin repeat domain-containing protein [Rivularia sp. MS3]